MEKIKIYNATNFIKYLDELVFILYREDYFQYIENAFEYTLKIYDFIDFSIQSFPRKKTPKSLLKYGDFYIFYKSNSRTTWYIFFSQKETTYLIKHITNNHSFDSNLIND